DVGRDEPDHRAGADETRPLQQVTEKLRVAGRDRASTVKARAVEGDVVRVLGEEGGHPRFVVFGPYALEVGEERLDRVRCGGVVSFRCAVQHLRHADNWCRAAEMSSKTSSRRARRKQLEQALLAAAPRMATDALFLHQAVADRLDLHVSDLRCLQVLSEV